jgi:hypothetical protein
LLAELFLHGAALCGVSINMGDGYSVPVYWARTNCRAYIKAEVNGATKGLVSGKVLIGGTPVAEETWPNPPRGPWRVPWQPRVMFDSSHFELGSSLEVRCEMVDADGQTTTNHLVLPVRNFVTSYGIAAVEQPPPPEMRGSFAWKTTPTLWGHGLRS